MGKLLFVGLLAALAVLAQSKPVQHNTPALSAIRRSLSGAEALQFDGFVDFMKKHQREYKDMSEVRQRFGIFQENLKVIAEAQKREKGTAKYGVTRFADMTREERIKYGTGLKLSETFVAPAPTSNFDHLLDADVPEALDLRAEGLVGPVKDQGNCGSCTFFSAIASLEGAVAKKTGKFVSLSEQQVIDCWPFHGAHPAYPCDGSIPAYTFVNIAFTGGIQCDKSYPYTSGRTGEGADSCSKVDKSKFAANATLGTHMLPVAREDLFTAVLAEYGPININIDADYIFWYNGGVLDAGEFEHKPWVNHAVALVGYGTEDGVPFWIVKNSWGDDFGEEGYFRVVRNKNSLYMSDTPPSFPIV